MVLLNLLLTLSENESTFLLWLRPPATTDNRRTDNVDRPSDGGKLGNFHWSAAGLVL
jgi:hypothetical protein